LSDEINLSKNTIHDLSPKAPKPSEGLTQAKNYLKEMAQEVNELPLGQPGEKVATSNTNGSNQVRAHNDEVHWTPKKEIRTSVNDYDDSDLAPDYARYRQNPDGSRDDETGPLDMHGDPINRVN